MQPNQPQLINKEANAAFDLLAVGAATTPAVTALANPLATPHIANFNAEPANEAPENNESLQNGINLSNVNYDLVDSNLFLNSFSQAKAESEPYKHFLLNNLFEPNLLNDVLHFPFRANHHNYNVGSREEFNSTRHYVDENLIKHNTSAQRLNSIFRNPNVIKLIEDRGGIKLKDSLLRIEYSIDTNNFWLKAHTDIGVKLFTMLIYLSDPPNNLNWGTDIYKSADEWFATVPYAPNTALVFYPNSSTWHGFERREIIGERRALILNYVTQEWRNRNELTHPEQPVY